MNTTLTSLSLPELESYLKAQKQPKFRAKQILDWLYQKQAQSYDEMTNLPATLRDTLADELPLTKNTIVNTQISTDGTRKYILRLADGNLVEMVGIPSRKKNAEGKPERLTVCFSTQVGCAMACAFCATGREGFTRNLDAGEMVDQVRLIAQDMNLRVSNVVAMGQGEGFLNYPELMKALHIMNAPWGLHIGARHITISTCGITKGIRDLSKEAEQYTLAISLHAAQQKTRDELMPRMKSTPLPLLKRALLEYVEATNRRVSLEYLLIKGINDGEQDLQALLDFCSDLLCHVNLLPVNSVEGSPLQASSPETTQNWLQALERAGVAASLRNSRGSDIDGACGQLKNKIHVS